jgi:predicted TPR repeat methyltransferase
MRIHPPTWREWLNSTGFDVLSTTGTQSRLDKGKPVQGYLALWRSSPR